MVGRARLVKELDRDRCFHSVAVRVDMLMFLKQDWNISRTGLEHKRRGRRVETKLSQSLPFHAFTFILRGPV